MVGLLRPEDLRNYTESESSSSVANVTRICFLLPSGISRGAHASHFTATTVRPKGKCLHPKCNILLLQSHVSTRKKAFFKRQRDSPVSAGAYEYLDSSTVLISIRWSVLYPVYLCVRALQSRDGSPFYATEWSATHFHRRELCGQRSASDHSNQHSSQLHQPA